MQFILDISPIVMIAFLQALFMPVFWIVIFLVYLQYRRMASTEKKLFGKTINGVGRQMFRSVSHGIFGGLIASLVLLFMGLSLEQIGLYFIWPVALLLLIMNPRYLCFSYAGGIVALAVLFVRHIILPISPALAQNSVVESMLRIHIPALLVLIGLLHLIEALLIYLGGHRGSSPIYLKQKDGNVVGAFSMQCFWPLPLVALIVSVVLQTEIVGVNMPAWWPVLQPALEPGYGQSLQYMLIPVAAGLGYSDLALSSTPLKRSRLSAKRLAVYSAVLLVLAVGSEYLSWFVLPGVLFAPLGHELLILYSKRKETECRLRYVPASTGVQLMMVLPGTAAEQAELRENDLILQVNGEQPEDNRDLMKKIEESYFMVLLEGIRDGKPFSTVLKKQPAENCTEKVALRNGYKPDSTYSLLHFGVRMGLIAVPAADSPVYLEIRKAEPLNKFRLLFSKIKSIFRRQK